MDDSALTHETNQVVKRQSGVELLKVIGIFLVILCHVVQTLIDWDQPWSIPINGGITDVTHFTIAFLRYTGMFGNILFFTCSAWFLLDKKQTNYKKVMRMILDIFVISVLWLIPILIWKKER